MSKCQKRAPHLNTDGCELPCVCRELNLRKNPVTFPAPEQLFIINTIYNTQYRCTT